MRTLRRKRAAFLYPRLTEHNPAPGMDAGANSSLIRCCQEYAAEQYQAFGVSAAFHRFERIEAEYEDSCDLVAVVGE